MQRRVLSPWWSTEADHSPLQQAPPLDPPPACRWLHPTPEDEPPGPSLWLPSSGVQAAALNQAGAATWRQDAGTPPATSTLNTASVSCRSERSSRQPKTETDRIQCAGWSVHLKQQFEMFVVTSTLKGYFTFKHCYQKPLKPSKPLKPAKTLLH